MRRDWPAFAALGLVAVAAVCLILTSSVIGFKQWSLSPNGPPYLLARSIEDGPGRLYLLEHCPQINLAMCHHLDRLDLSTDDFLWHDNGVYKLVSREEAAQLRAEGNRVFVQAAFEHPWMQLKAFVVNATYQLGYFTLGDFRIPSYPVLQHGEMTLYPWSPDDVGGDAPPEVAPWKLPANVAVYGVVIISVVACCAFWVRGQLSRDLRDLFLLVLGAVLINAMAVVASTATPRYEARLIWLLPVVALIALWRSRLTGNVQRSTSPSG